MRWPKAPPHLALNPPFVWFVLFSFLFLFSFLVLEDKPVLTPKNRSFFIFQCLPLFLPSFLFNFPFSHSLSRSLSLSLSLVLFFLPSFFAFVFAFASLCLSPCLFALFLCFCFMKRTTSNYSIWKPFHQSFLFFWFPVLVSLSNAFFLSLCFCPNFKLCSLFNINVLLSKKNL